MSLSKKVAETIVNKFPKLTAIPIECCLFKVQSQLRQVNEAAYEPQLLAIGPYHRGKACLQGMEGIKLQYLQLLLSRLNETSVERYTEAMEVLREKAVKCYSESTELTEEEFIQMLVLDGIFIVELFRNYQMEDPREVSDPISSSEDMHFRIERDLLVYENQLPFFILEKLFTMSENPTSPSNHTLIDLAQNFFNLTVHPISDNLVQESRHLLGLVRIRMNLIAAQQRIINTNAIVRTGDWELMPSATALWEFGVKFRPASKPSIFDIQFNDGLMLIPPLRIDDRVESILRNLIAVEQYTKVGKINFIIDYVYLIESLIKSPKDVEFLTRKGIIKHGLGDHGAVSLLFNRLAENVNFSENSAYCHLLNEVNKYCNSRQNTWMAKLRHTYLSSPWTLISLLMGMLMLLFGAIQALFSVLSYISPKGM